MDIGAALTIFVTQMLGLSIAAERVTETIKQWLKSKASAPTAVAPAATVPAVPVAAVVPATLPTPQAVAKRTAGYQFLAFLSGMLVVALAHVDPLQIVSHWGAVGKPWSTIHLPRVISIVVTGLLVSGGSSAWNNILDLLSAAKVNNEQIANAVLANANQPPIAA